MPSALIAEQQQTFVRNFNRSSFEFDHTLEQLELFSMANIVAMSERLPDRPYFSTVENSISGGWRNVGDRRLSLRETLDLMAESNSLVLLRNCERDPVFGPAFLRIMGDVVDYVGPVLRDDVEVGRATLVISSPGRITSYHIDGEVNFLLQMRGEKELHAFDPRDKSILMDSELEAFYAGDPDGARYKSELQEQARVFNLAPGKGVHLPLHAPHWAKNGSSVSVGLSINFNLRSSARPATVFKVNRGLRKVGFAPVAPGISTLQDGLKVAAFKGLSFAKPLVEYARAARRPRAERE
jgi:hypothetical protein